MERTYRLENLPRNLRRILAAEGIKQTQFARMTGLDPGNMSRIINGQRTLMADSLIAIKNALPNTTFEELLR